jgi:D-alanine-D-alanine ligase
VLIEDYIPGREINVALWGADEPEILPLYEIDFQWTSDPFQRIVSFDSKWVKESVEYSGTPGICPAGLSSRDEGSIREVALRAYELLGIRSYARIDIRLFEGIPYILEVNANPDLAPNAGFYRTAKAAGFSYPQMVRRITQLALESQP